MITAPTLSLTPDITVAIATIGTRLANIQLPPPVAGLRYEILVQRPPAVMPRTTRSDVRYTPLDTVGLSHSRNSALAHCDTEFLVFADDDMALDTDGLRALAGHMLAAPHLGFTAGWRMGRLPASGRRAGRYTLRKHNAGRLCAPELMIRVETIRASGVRFDTRFGVGAAQPVGEDYVFVCDMLDAGLHAEAFPIVTGAHPDMSTGDDWGDLQLLAARRAVLMRCFGGMAPVMRLAYALRHRKRMGGWLGAWRFWAGRIKSGENPKI